jgi:hypothetical protein
VREFSSHHFSLPFSRLSSFFLARNRAAKVFTLFSAVGGFFGDEIKRFLDSRALSNRYRLFSLREFLWQKFPDDFSALSAFPGTKIRAPGFQAPPPAVVGRFFRENFYARRFRSASGCCRIFIPLEESIAVCNPSFRSLTGSNAAETFGAAVFVTPWRIKARGNDICGTRMNFHGNDCRNRGAWQPHGWEGQQGKRGRQV